MVIDYSRWDAIDVSSDDETEQVGGPRVHRLGPETSGELRVGNVTLRSRGRETEQANGDGEDQGARPSASASPSLSERDEYREELKILSKSGARYDKYLWSQDRFTCTLSVLVPRGTRARDVSVSLSKFDHEGGAKRSRCLRVTHEPSGTSVGGDLEHYCGAEDADLISHWEVKDLRGSAEGERVIQVELRKHQVAENVVMWWKRLFADEANSVDLAAIEERKQGHGEAFAQAWEAAHDTFKQKMRDRQQRAAE